MDREHFLQQVEHLRQQGQSIWSIATACGVNRGRVERAIKSLAWQRSSRSGGYEQRSAAGPFVGRQHEMNTLQTIWEEALAGQGRLVMLGGEPGMGKTRMAQSLSTIVLQQGGRVLWGRCHAEHGDRRTGPGRKSSMPISRSADGHSCGLISGETWRLSPKLCRVSGNGCQTSGHCQALRIRSRPDSDCSMPSRAFSAMSPTGSLWC